MVTPTYKMIAIDLDGTLLSPEGKVTQRTRDAIHACLSAGMLVCFATGRNWTESRDILETLEHYPTAVFVGGAMVVDTGNRITLHRTMMQPPLAMEVCRLLETAGQPVLALEDQGEAGVQYVISTHAPVNEATRVWMEVTGARLRKRALGTSSSAWRTAAGSMSWRTC